MICRKHYFNEQSMTRLFTRAANGEEIEHPCLWWGECGCLWWEQPGLSRRATIQPSLEIRDALTFIGAVKLDDKLTISVVG